MEIDTQPRPGHIAPLANHVVFSTTDIDLARVRAAAYFAPHRLRFVDRQPSFRARMHASDVSDVLLAYLEYGVEFTLDSLELMNRTALLFPVSGAMRLRQGGREVIMDCANGGIVRPDLVSSLDWGSDLSVLVLAFDQVALDRHIRCLVGTPTDDQLVFDNTIRPEHRASTWQGIVGTLLGVAERSGGAVPPLVAKELARAAMTTLLVSQQHNYAAAMAAPARPAVPGAVRRVAELMTADAGADHDVATLAATAGISVRSLQAGFRQAFGMSPTEYLRDVRLVQVHRALVADPDRTVAEVANAFGFVHLGRFSAAYRRKFGQLPSATIRGGNAYRRKPKFTAPSG